MKERVTRLLALAVLAMVSVMLVAAASAKQETILNADKLIILSTTDVKGKTSPCG